MTDTTTKSGKVIDFSKLLAALMTIVTIVGTAWGVVWGPIGGWIDARELDAANTAANTAAITALVEQQGEQQQEQQTAFAELLSAVSSNTEVQASLVRRVEDLENTKSQRVDPVIRFARFGHSIEDGRVGGQVEITWSYFKLADCRAPVVDLWMRNGGGRLHRFQDISVVGTSGRGVNSDVLPNENQNITYTARIPSNEGVEAGQGFGWVEISYPDCPRVKPVKSPEVAFNILE